MLAQSKPYREHPEIKHVWYDEWCMPQGKERTPPEVADFQRMLKQINFLYLGARVLILLDLSYLSRFWTQFEAWLSMQQPTSVGLRRAIGAERREPSVLTVISVRPAPAAAVSSALLRGECR